MEGKAKANVEAKATGKGESIDVGLLPEILESQDRFRLSPTGVRRVREFWRPPILTIPVPEPSMAALHVANAAKDEGRIMPRPRGYP